MRLRFFDGTGQRTEFVQTDDKAFWQSIKDDPNYLYFEEEIANNEKIHIKIPRGSWDIMEALANKVLKYVPGDIVEIGMGESSEVLGAIAQQWGSRLYSCDIQMGGMFKLFEQPLFLNHICYIGKSEDFIKQYDGFPAVVFIDGEHKYEAVKREVDFFLPRLLYGGVMFLHDTFPQYEHQIAPDEKGWSPGDVYKVRQELERNNEVDVMTFPYSAVNMGLTVILKHDERKEFWLKNGHSVSS